MNKRQKKIAELAKIDTETIQWLQTARVAISDLAKEIGHEMPKVEWLKREIDRHLVVVAPHGGACA